MTFAGRVDGLGRQSRRTMIGDSDTFMGDASHGVFSDTGGGGGGVADDVNKYGTISASMMMQIDALIGLMEYRQHRAESI